MDFTRLNPVVRSAGIFESVGCGEERIAYDARIIYVVSGDLTASIDSEKLGHLGPGHMLYIPSGVPYKLRGQYFRVAALTFDLTGESPEPSERMAPVATALFDPSLLHPTAEHAPFDKYIYTCPIWRASAKACSRCATSSRVLSASIAHACRLC